MRKFLIFAVAACGAFAVAENEGSTGTVKSEYFYQTEANVNQATPELGYTTATSKGKAAGSKDQDTTATILKVKYERGINEMFSAGGTLGYVMGKTDLGTGLGSNTGADNKGMDDLHLFGKGNYSFVAGQSLNYGADLSYPMGKKKFEADSVSVTTGSIILTPYIGYQMLMGPHVFGARLMKQQGLTKGKWENTQNLPAATKIEYDVTGGLRSSLTGFYETMLGGGTWGGELGWWNDETLVLKNDNAILAAAGAGESRTAGETGYSLAVYTKYDVMANAQVIGQATYEDALSTHNLDSSTKYGLNVAGRYSF